MLTRFAPSPTGYLHLGHLAHMIYVWGVASRHDAGVLLRMEDHDRARCKPEFEQAIVEDLAWLNLKADAGFGIQVDPDFRQSDCDARYTAALGHLFRSGYVYACACSRREIANRTGEDGLELRYDNHCRDLGLPLTEGYAWRVALPDTASHFGDLRMGPQTQHPQKQCGDVVIRDRTGNWTYQFCVVVDDIKHRIDLVVRGADLLESTGRQMLLAELLGQRDHVRYYHHPLICDESGRKLSKRDFDEGLCDMRRRGVPPEAALGLAAWRVGLQTAPEPLRANEIPQLFREMA